MSQRATSVPPGWGKDRPFPSDVPSASDDSSLNVALYPYVPEPSWFKAAITSAWQQVHPEIALNWVDYNCYSADPPSTLDVFAFDAIFNSYFASQKFLQPIAVDTTDFYPWALTGLAADSESLWAVPYLGCMNVLIYRANDPELSAPNLTVNILEKILGDSPDLGPQPPSGQGLLVDLTGGTTDACLYLQAVMENQGQYPLDPTLPACPSELDPSTMSDLETLVRVAGRAQASYVDQTGYDRLNWFLAGFGRAMVGLTETLHSFPGDSIGQYIFQPLPVASASVSVVPLYADAVAVNANVDPFKRSLAVELCILISSADVTLAAFVGDGSANPQYLTPVRPSVLSALSERFPLYGLIGEIVWRSATTGFRIGEQSRSWLQANKSCIVQQILGPSFQVDELLFAAPGYPSTPGGLWRKA